MDTLTHALSGALLVRAAIPALPRRQPSAMRARLLAGGVAAAFPDADIVLRPVDTLAYLNFHQGLTHSLVMLPVWAWLLALLFARLNRNTPGWRMFFAPCALGLGAHIAGDLITNYGLMLFAPLSTWRVSVPTTFVIDFYFSAIIVIGLAACWRWRGTPRPAILALSVLVGYVSAQAVFRDQAIGLGEAYARAVAIRPAEVQALAQPLSPFNWKVIVREGTTLHVAQVNLLRTDDSAPTAADATFIERLAASYHSPRQLMWVRHELFGGNPSEYPVVRAAWQDDALAEYRRFARYPALYTVERDREKLCVGFVDVRFVLAGMTPPFVYSACRESLDASWRLVQRS